MMTMSFTVGTLPDVVRGGYIATNFTSTTDQALISFPFRFVYLPDLVGPCHWEACDLPSKIYSMSKASEQAQAQQPTSKQTTGPRLQLPRSWGHSYRQDSYSLALGVRWYWLLTGSKRWWISDCGSLEFRQCVRDSCLLLVGFYRGQWHKREYQETGSACQWPRPSHETLDMSGVIALSEQMFLYSWPIIFEALGKNWGASPLSQCPTHFAAGMQTRTFTLPIEVQPSDFQDTCSTPLTAFHSPKRMFSSW